MKRALRNHWPEYLMEAAELAIFMISASLFTILLYHPSSPAVRAIPPEFIRRMLMGLAMGLTLVGIVYSPWGKQSGAHMNPAFTLTFFRLGKVAPADAVFYVLAQFAGGMLGILAVATAVTTSLAHPAVNYVATVPGPNGPLVAFLGEAAIAFLLLIVVLTVSNTPKLARWTGLFAGACVASFITFEAPLSGMSMNPARTLGSAFLPHLWNSLWIYFTAPLLGMLRAAEVYPLFKGRVFCAKYHHQNNHRCIFCEYHVAQEARRSRHRQPNPSENLPSAATEIGVADSGRRAAQFRAATGFSFWQRPKYCALAPSNSQNHVPRFCPESDLPPD